MKLLLTDPFSIEYGDITLKGEFTPLTKKQNKEVEKLSPKKELKESAKLSKKIIKLKDKIETSKKLEKWLGVETFTEILDGVEAEYDALQDKIESYDPEDIYKKILELAVSGEDKKDIMALYEVASYSTILDTIKKDIQETNAKN